MTVRCLCVTVTILLLLEVTTQPTTSSTKTFYVTVATSTSAHVHHGSGSSNKYKINGVFSPFLRLIPGITYRFDQSDSSNSGHPFRFIWMRIKIPPIQQA